MFTSYIDNSINVGSSSANIDSYEIGAYGGYRRQQFKITFGASATLHDINTERSISFREINNFNTADFKGRSLLGFAELSYVIPTKIVQVEPFASISYAYLKTNTWSEKFSDSALRGTSSQNDDFGTTIGMRLSRTNTISEDVKLDSNLLIGWEHDIAQTPRSELNFYRSQYFEVDGLPVKPNTLILGSGITLDINKDLKLGLSYQGKIADKLRNHMIEANLKIKF